MMRGPSQLGGGRAQAGRRDRRGPQSIDSPMARHRIFRLPIIRGIVALGESLAIGFRALAISANYAAQEEEARTARARPSSRAAQLFFAFAVAIGFAVALFKVGRRSSPTCSRSSSGGVRGRRGLIRVSDLRPLPDR